MNTTSPDDEKPREDHEDFRIHRLLVIGLYFVTLFIVLFLMALLVFVWKGKLSSSILILAIMAGALGAFVSALRRLYAFESIFPSERFRASIKNAKLYLIVYSLIPPLIGAIAAAVLYVFFAAQIIESNLFPKFVCEPDGCGCTDFEKFIQYWGPAGPTDYAKAALWGFVAGFSERFVPDILNRLVERANSGVTNLVATNDKGELANTSLSTQRNQSQ